MGGSIDSDTDAMAGDMCVRCLLTMHGMQAWELNARGRKKRASWLGGGVSQRSFHNVDCSDIVREGSPLQTTPATRRLTRWACRRHMRLPTSSASQTHQNKASAGTLVGRRTWIVNAAERQDKTKEVENVI